MDHSSIFPISYINKPVHIYIISPMTFIPHYQSPHWPTYPIINHPHWPTYPIINSPKWPTYPCYQWPAYSYYQLINSLFPYIYSWLKHEATLGSWLGREQWMWQQKKAYPCTVLQCVLIELVYWHMSCNFCQMSLIYRCFSTCSAFVCGFIACHCLVDICRAKLSATHDRLSNDFHLNRLPFL